MFIGLVVVALVIIGFDLLASRFGSEPREGSATSISPLPIRSLPPAVRQHPRLIRRGR